VDLSFMRRLDPALKRVVDPSDPAVLVVHFVRHRDPLFVEGPGGLPLADPIECLLDLQESGLEAQALSFVDWIARRAQGEA